MEFSCFVIEKEEPISWWPNASLWVLAFATCQDLRAKGTLCRSYVVKSTVMDQYFSYRGNSSSPYQNLFE
jgi:hypothetical protein